MMYYDFHIHSALSPCGDVDMTPNNIVGLAKLIGLDAIAVTDHNTVGNVGAVMEAGKRVGIRVVPGMEVQTAEEVHILTLFPTQEAAGYVAERVYRSLPEVPNRPEIFGEQLLFDGEDRVIGREEKLLLSSSALSVNQLFSLVEEAGGLFAPAHVDRHSYSILTNLGFLPPELPIRWIELSRRVDCPEDYIGSRPDLAGLHVLRNSDAHYLTDLAEPDAAIEQIEALFPSGGRL